MISAAPIPTEKQITDAGFPKNKKKRSALPKINKNQSLVPKSNFLK